MTVDTEARLARIEAELEEAGQRVTEQALLYERMKADGHDGVEEMKLLRILEAIYVELVRFRQLLREASLDPASPDMSACPDI